jgi:hypothetical protein
LYPDGTVSRPVRLLVEWKPVGSDVSELNRIVVKDAEIACVVLW